jgi:transcriptional regulator with XRE-family HTH domain
MKHKRDDKQLMAMIGNTVVVARARCGLTQEELAKKIKTKQSGIARLENPTAFPSFRFVNKVANALDQNIIFGFSPKDIKDQRFTRIEKQEYKILPKPDKEPKSSYFDGGNRSENEREYVTSSSRNSSVGPVFVR